MAHMVRALRQCPIFQKHWCGCNGVHHFLSLSSSCVPNVIDSRRPSFATIHSGRRDVHYRSKGIRVLNARAPADVQEEENVDDDSDVKKSRNQLKREARRAVEWGMELATFSTPQIKRILRVASLERDVFDALMVVKGLGRDVREGKRRQFSYIGKLLRDAQPELMESLIQATKDGDHSMLQALSGSIALENDEDDDDTESEEEEEGVDVEIVTRWLDGLISKDNYITKEIYSLRSVDFDRQELRKLVRKVHSLEDQKAEVDENDDRIDKTIISARKSLARFLRSVAKQVRPS